MAAAVTVTDAVVAFPFAYFMARIASPRTRTALFVAILLPLWASYLAKVYSWLLIFTHNGLLDWSLGKLGLGQVHLIYTNWAVFTVFCYLWLPFMIIPVYAALERIPASQMEASQDLGARTWRTTRSVLLPLALPGIVAGSIFTFSLTLGDYITPLLVGGTSANFMGNIIYSNIGIANNVPFAAAMALRPDRHHGRLPARRPGARRVRGDLTMESRGLRVALRIWVGLVLAFLFVPIVLIVLYAFNPSNIESWPISGFSRTGSAWRGTTPRCAARSSCRSGSGWSPPCWPCCSAPLWPTRCISSGSSAARPSPSCSCCRSPCPASSPVSR